MHTEDEAKNKWCPMARTCYTDAREGSSVSNRNIDEKSNLSTYGARCLGSDCMMWRWLDPEIQRFRAYEMGQTPDGDGWECTTPDTGREAMQIKSFWQRLNPNRRGYCGLAGKPEVQ